MFLKMSSFVFASFNTLKYSVQSNCVFKIFACRYFTFYISIICMFLPILITFFIK